MNTYQAARRGQRGVGLIEVMVALLVLSVGMLGVAALQSVSLSNSLSASQRTLAVTQSYAIIDAMRANRSVALIGSYDTGGFTCEAPVGGSLVADDLRSWILALKVSLGPSACGKVDCGADSCLVEVRWNDQRGTAGDQDWSALAVSTRTRL